MGLIIWAGIVFWCYFVYCTFKDSSNDTSDKVGWSSIMLFITVLVTALLCVLTFVCIEMTTDNKVKVVDVGGWDIKVLKPTQELHSGNKGRTYDTNNFHLLVNNSDGSFRMISLPANECIIKEIDGQPRAERFDTIETNKISTVLIGNDTMKSSTKYVISIPKGSVIETFVVM